jgi:hypothetical protein
VKRIVSKKLDVQNPSRVTWMVVKDTIRSGENLEERMKKGWFGVI